MMSPAIFIALGIRQRVLRGRPIGIRLFVVVFLCVWSYGWFGSITHSFLKSLNDWKSMKQAVANGSPPQKSPVK
jgi:hypothetical protein